MPQPVTIIYITSLGASGSTLVDLLLSAHPEVFSVGEVVHLSDLAHQRRNDLKAYSLGNECTCGAPTIAECPFWRRVEAVIRERSGLALTDLELQVSNTEHFARDNRLVFEAVAEVSGRRYIVDSSKDPGRLRALLGAGFAEVRPIHLFRDPRGMINSRLRRGHRLLHMCAFFNYRTWLIRRTLAGTASFALRYDRLVRDPGGEIEAAMRFIGLTYDPAQLQWAGRERHNIGGNRMRRSSDSTIREDTKWRRELRWWQKLTIQVLTFPARLMVAPLSRRTRRAGGL